MSTLQPLLLENMPAILLVAKTVLAIAIVASLCTLMRSRSSAALRHRLWVVTLTVVLLMPLFTLLPNWSLRLIPAATPVQPIAEQETDPGTPLPASQAGTGTKPAVVLETARADHGGHMPGTGSFTAVSSETAHLPFDETGAAAMALSIQDPVVRTATPRDEAEAPARAKADTGTLSHDADKQPESAARFWHGLVIAGWIVGGLVTLLPLILGTIRLHSICHQARSLDHDPAWRLLLNRCREQMGVGRIVRLLSSDQVQTPVTFGLRRPVVVVPGDCDAWPEDQRELVLLHEFAHVARGDWGWMLVARLTVSAHWFNPAVRLAAKHVHSEAEAAADNAVLARGCAASAYAECLLRFTTAGTGPATALSLPMSRGVDTHRRLQMILNPTSHRRPLSRKLGWLTALTVAGLALPLSVLQVAEAQQENEPATAHEESDTHAEETHHDHAYGGPKIDSQDAGPSSIKVNEAANPLVGTWYNRRTVIADGEKITSSFSITFFDDGLLIMNAPDLENPEGKSRYEIKQPDQLLIYDDHTNRNPSVKPTNTSTFTLSDEGNRLIITPENGDQPAMVLQRTATPAGTDQLPATVQQIVIEKPALLIDTWEVRSKDGSYEGAIRFLPSGEAHIWENEEDGRFKPDAIYETAKFTIRDGGLHLADTDGQKTESWKLTVDGTDRVFLDTDYILTRVKNNRSQPHGLAAIPRDPGARAIAPVLLPLLEPDRATKALNKIVSVDFHARPLNEVIYQLQEQTDINVIINTRRLEANGADIETPITMTLNEVQARTALTFALELAANNISWDIREGVLVIE